MQQILRPTMLGNVSSMLSKCICYATMLWSPFITLDTLFQHPEDSHKPVNSDYEEDSEEENIPLSKLGQRNHDSDYEEDSEDEDIYHFQSLGSKITPIGLLPIQMIFPKTFLFPSLVCQRWLPRVDLQRGAVIWNPVTLYDRTTLISDFVWRSRDISIHEYERVGVERYPSYDLTWTGIFVSMYVHNY
jgi:hypothetical protein